MKRRFQLKITILIILISITNIFGKEQKVLFLGNSYTFYNNLPGLFSTLSKSAGKDIMVESNSPGGMIIQGHLSDPISLSLIRAGNWDYIILQEQSQLPTIDYYKYNSMFPAMTYIADTIRKYNPCAVIVSYMTWGRRYGGMQSDPSGEHRSPDFKDFSHMQDSLESAYIEISNKIKAVIAPAGIAWKNVILNSEYVLHDTDLSHPNYDGTYLTACVFYGIIHNDKPTNITDNSLLDSTKASYFRQVAEKVIDDDKLKWNTFYNYPIADFKYKIEGKSVNFENFSHCPDNVNYFWDFGDGNVSTAVNPKHTYDNDNNYEVNLTIEYCGKITTEIKKISISTSHNNENNLQNIFEIYPNPASNYLIIKNLAERNELNTNTELKIYNSYGDCVYIKDYSSIIEQVDLSMFPIGLYTLKIDKYFHNFLIIR